MRLDTFLFIVAVVVSALYWPFDVLLWVVAALSAVLLTVLAVMGYRVEREMREYREWKAEWDREWEADNEDIRREYDVLIADLVAEVRRTSRG